MLSGRGYYDAVMLHGFQIGPMLAAGRDPADRRSREERETVQSGAGHRRLHPAALQDGGLLQGQAVRLHQLELQPGLLGPRRSSERPRASRPPSRRSTATISRPPRRSSRCATSRSSSPARRAARSPASRSRATSTGSCSRASRAARRSCRCGGTSSRTMAATSSTPTASRPSTVRRTSRRSRCGRRCGNSRRPASPSTSLIDVPTVMGNGIAAQTIAWSDFVLGVDKPGKSPYAGKFVYGPIPAKAGREASRTAEAEPSVTVISAASKNAGGDLPVHPVARREEAAGEADRRRRGRRADPQQLVGDAGSHDRPAEGAVHRHEERRLDVSTGKPKMPKFFEIYDELTGSRAGDRPRQDIAGGRAPSRAGR